MQALNTSSVVHNSINVDPVAGGNSIQTTFRTSTLPLFDKPIIDKSVTGPSKILARKWRDKDLSRHRQNLAVMKPITHNQPTQPVFINKQKNEQMTEDRYTEIERENRILF
jgi:hypothetical protein